MSSNSPTECKKNLTLLNKLSFKKVFYLTWHPDTWKLIGHNSTVQHFSTNFSVKSTKTLLVFMHNFNLKISIGCLTVHNYFSAPLPFHTKAVTSKKQVGTKHLNNIRLYIMLCNLTIGKCKRTSLNALCVSKWRLILLSASWGLSYACSISPNSSLWDWFNRLFTLQKKKTQTRKNKQQLEIFL